MDLEQTGKRERNPSAKKVNKPKNNMDHILIHRRPYRRRIYYNDFAVKSNSVLVIWKKFQKVYSLHNTYFSLVLPDETKFMGAHLLIP